MLELDKDKTRGWSGRKYLFVLIISGLITGFLSQVVYPLVKEQLSARLAKLEPAAPPASNPPPRGLPRSAEERPTTPAPRDVQSQPPTGLSVAPAPTSVKFRDILIEQPFDQAFARKPALMDTPQVYQFELPNGRVGVVCVVQARLHVDTPAGRVEAMQVCENKMAAALLTWKNDLNTARDNKVSQPTDQLDAKILTSLKGHVRVLQPVGRWSSGPGDVLYMAYGQVYAPGELKP